MVDAGVQAQLADVVALNGAARPDSYIGLHSSNGKLQDTMFMCGWKDVQLPHMFMNGISLEGKIISMCLEVQVFCDTTHVLEL